MSCEDCYVDYGEATLSKAEERAFEAVLSTGPLLHSNAIVVLCGEDAGPRIEAAAELMGKGGAPLILLTGGVHDGARWLGAEACFAKLIAKGVAFERMEIDPFPTNTREQATHIAKIAIEREWTRLLLVASPYHAPRAFLTFVQALREQDAHERIRVLSAPASPKWWEAPAGMTEMRLDLQRVEAAKVVEYQAKGDVASYADGLAYLKFWEGK